MTLAGHWRPAILVREGMAWAFARQDLAAPQAWSPERLSGVLTMAAFTTESFARRSLGLAQLHLEARMG